MVEKDLLTNIFYNKAYKVLANLFLFKGGGKI